MAMKLARLPLWLWMLLAPGLLPWSYCPCLAAPAPGAVAPAFSLKAKTLNYFRAMLAEARKALANAHNGEDRHEFGLRTAFLERLTNRLEAHYTADVDLKIFLVTQIDDLASVEAADPQGDPSLIKFLHYLAIAIKMQSERSEDLASFVEGYILYAGILSPIRPQDYLALRSYSNGKDVYAAKGVSRQAVGEVVEGRLKQLPPAGRSLSPLPK
jgi:hypothetical protein